MQAASDVYVAAQQGALLSETDLIHSVISNYILISGFGERKACVQLLANSPRCVEQSFSRTTAF